MYIRVICIYVCACVHVICAGVCICAPYAQSLGAWAWKCCNVKQARLCGACVLDAVVLRCQTSMSVRACVVCAVHLFPANLFSV